MKKVFEKIRELRKNRGLTQTELAELSGTSLPSISRIERGKETIQLDVLQSILDVLGYEIQLIPKGSESRRKK